MHLRLLALLETTCYAMNISIYQTWCNRQTKKSLEKPPTLSAGVSHWCRSKWRRAVRIFLLSV